MLDVVRALEASGIAADSVQEGGCALDGVGRLYLAPDRASLLLERHLPDSDAERFWRALNHLPACTPGRTASQHGVVHFSFAAAEEETDQLWPRVQTAVDALREAGFLHG